MHFKSAQSVFVISGQKNDKWQFILWQPLEHVEAAETRHLTSRKTRSGAWLRIAFNPAKPSSQSSRTNNSGIDLSRARMPRLASGSSSTISTLYFIADSLRRAAVSARDFSHQLALASATVVAHLDDQLITILMWNQHRAKPDRRHSLAFERIA